MRPPITPAGTANNATSETTPGEPPIATNLLLPRKIAIATPRIIASA